MSIDYKQILINLAVFLICLLILSLWGFYSAIRPSKIKSKITPSNFDVKFQSVEFKTEDNLLIRGWFIPNESPRAKTIILLHGYPADKGDILPSRIFLHKKYHLLFLDFRYLGESGGSYSTVGKSEVLDVLAAIKYLHQQGINEVGIWGFSVGGAVALMTAAVAPTIKAVIADSSYARLDLMARDYFRIPLLKYPLGYLLRLWGYVFLGYDINEVSPVLSASKLNIPVLLIHSKADEVVTYEHAELFKSQLSNKKNVAFLVYDDLAHGQDANDYQKNVEDFFEKNL